MNLYPTYKVDLEVSDQTSRVALELMPFFWSGASESAELAEAWAQGQEPGGPGTKSALGWAESTRLVPRGGWALNTSYQVNNMLTRNGSSYVCLLDHTSAANDEPGVGPSWGIYWELLASRGEDGDDATIEDQIINGGFF